MARRINTSWRRGRWFPRMRRSSRRGYLFAPSAAPLVGLFDNRADETCWAEQPLALDVPILSTVSGNELDSLTIASPILGNLEGSLLPEEVLGIGTGGGLPTGEQSNANLWKPTTEKFTVRSVRGELVVSLLNNTGQDNNFFGLTFAYAIIRLETEAHRNGFDITNFPDLPRNYDKLKPYIYGPRFVSVAALDIGVSGGNLSSSEVFGIPAVRHLHIHARCHIPVKPETGLFLLMSVNPAITQGDSPNVFFSVLPRLRAYVARTR